MAGLIHDQTQQFRYVPTATPASTPPERPPELDDSSSAEEKTTTWKCNKSNAPDEASCRMKRVSGTQNFCPLCFVVVFAKQE